ncbi:MAG TPA: peroxidase-related enzyme [Candidatus Nitrosotenuis sp.]|nr:peroxidase-related enzyme [Candidatus Nitrosotenuis sp.]
MSFVGGVSETEARGEVAAFYAELKKSWGKVPNWFLAQGSRPDIVQTEAALFNAIFTDGALPQKLKEQIGVVVAGINHSSYCIAIHSDVLQRFAVPRALARTLAVNFPEAPVSEAEMALFRFAAKLTKQPDSIQQADADELRRHGWNDAQILETVLAVSMMNFANRISSGLGLVVDF